MSLVAKNALTPRQYNLACAAAVTAVLAHAPHLPLLVTLPVLAIIAASWLLRRRGGAALPGWIKLALIVVFLLILLVEYHGILGREPGSALACAMLALKMLETRSRRDARALVSFASFTLMVALLFDTSLMFTLATFMGVALLLASLRELEVDATASSKPASMPTTYWPALRASLIALALATPLALCGFLFIPRLDSPLWRTPVDAGARTGISDTMSPGSVQDLLLDDSAAFRVDFGGTLPPRAQLYWRGPVLTDFDGTTWRRRDTGIIGKDADGLTATGDAVSYEVTLEASGQPWMFALDLPLDIPSDTLPSDILRSRDMSLMRRRPVTNLLRYRVRSALTYRLDINLTPAQRKAALALPNDFNPRSTAQGQAWRTELHDDDAIIHAALKLFHDAFFYTLAPPLGRDSVDDFLFDTKRGFCEHYASAFVVLMRAAGIPARIVTGYQGGYFNNVGNYLVVRQSDAHAWAEVWLAGRGWVRVDPTAAVSPQRVEFGAQAIGAGERAWYQGGWLLALRNQFDLVNRGWNTLVVQFNGQRQQSLLNPFGIDRVEPATLVWLLIGVSGLLLTGATLWAMRTARRRTAPLDAAYDALCRKLARIATPRGASEGPRDYMQRVHAANALDELSAGDVARLFSRYVSLRYSRAFPSLEEVASFRRDVNRLRLGTRD
jgi:transglutaminase-like putative cysteine protease